jgi:anhydro-N-acetylmuramic acid kinase
MPETTRIIAGAMSGTSADGVDIALTEIIGRGLAMRLRLLLHHHYAYSPSLRQRIFDIRANAQTTLRELGELGREISLAHAVAVKDAVKIAKLHMADIAAIAAHGQTLFHAPPNTIQWFDPSLLAWETSCVVVSDFRRADCAAGGQGAPLVPFADYVLFRDATQDRVILNLGGIANLTWLPAGADLSKVIAFDTGPANCISDWLCRERDPRGLGYDAQGAMASGGAIIEPILQSASADSFFAAPPPKSTDIPRMIEIFRAAMKKNSDATLQDLLRTACELAARQIVAAIQRLHVSATAGIIASGGGIENQCLMTALERLSGRNVRTTDMFGIPSSAKEAMAFALLGAATLDGEASNVPSVTGAARAVVLGSITPRP